LPLGRPAAGIDGFLEPELGLDLGVELFEDGCDRALPPPHPIWMLLLRCALIIGADGSLAAQEVSLKTELLAMCAHDAIWS